MLLSRDSQRPKGPYIKALLDIFGGFNQHQLPLETVTLLTATGIFAYKLLNSTIRHFSRNTQKTSCINSSTSNKLNSYLVIIVCCCGLEFQFLSVPTYSRLPYRSTLPTLRSNLRSLPTTLLGIRHYHHQ
jgi:hypothetical protein